MTGETESSVAWRIAAFGAVAAALLSACASTGTGPAKAYEGKARAPEQLALISTEQPTNANSETTAAPSRRIVAIDGKPVTGKGPVTQAWVTPGEHAIMVERRTIASGDDDATSVPVEILTVPATAGESYNVRSHIVGDREVSWVENKGGQVEVGQAAGPSAYDEIDAEALLTRYEAAADDPALRGDMLEHATNETFAIQVFRMEPDAARRVSALKHINDQEFLSSIALLYDEDPIVRQAAIPKLDSVDVLAKLAVKSPDDVCRLAAKRRIMFLNTHSDSPEVRHAAFMAAEKLIAEKRW